MTQENQNVETVQYAGFWIRFVAFMLDSVAATILIAPIIYFLVGETNMEDYNLQDPEQLAALLNRLSVQMSIEALIFAVIFIMFWTFKSATPGKLLLKCSIVDAKTLGKASNSQNIIRYLGYFVSMFSLFLGFIWIAFDARKQGWHDKIAGTVVIMGRPRDEAPSEMSNEQQ
jgi:uncharacterized RDD family membrane protein YckC